MPSGMIPGGGVSSWNHFFGIIFLESFLVGGGDLKTWPLKLELFFKGCCYSKASISFLFFF